MTINPARYSSPLPSDGFIPIRTVSNLTGVNSVTLRAWERRYGLIKPLRTPKGHRLYTLADVELINRIVALLDNGMAISQVSQVLDSRSAASTDPPAITDPWLDYQQRLIEAVSRFDEGALNAVYHDALSFYPLDIVIHKLIVPLLRELGRRWETAQGSIAEEHFFSVFMRNKLGARFHHHSQDARGARLVAACLPGEQHEVGILLFSLAALDHGYQVILLGANMPLAELPAVVARTHSQAVVLSGSAGFAVPALAEDLSCLARGAGVPVFVGGQSAVHHAQELAACGVIPLGDALGPALRQMGALLARRQAWLIPGSPGQSPPAPHQPESQSPPG